MTVSYRHGDEMAEKLDYVPMPDNVVELVKSAWKDEISGPDGNPVLP